MILALILIPLVAALLVACGVKARPLAIAASLLNLLVLIGIMSFANIPALGQFEAQIDSSYTLGSGAFALQLGFGDGLSLLMVLLSCIVGFSAVLATKADQGDQKMYYASTLLIIAGAIGAFASINLFYFFAFHELALIPTYLMLALYGKANRKHVAMRTLLFLALGSMLLLAGLVLLFSHYGTADMSVMYSLIGKEDISHPGLIAALLLAGFGALVAIFPLHSWAAPAYANAPTPIAMLHAGVLKKYGLYGLIRLAPLVLPGFAAINNVLLVLLVCNILWVGYCTVNQKRLDNMLGQSSVMHMGYIFLGLAAWISMGCPLDSSSFGYKGACLLMFAHGITIALLFCLADIIERSTGSQEFYCLGGLARQQPVLAFVFGTAAMASIGLPGLINFPGEIMVFFSGFNDGWKAGQAFGPLQYATIAALWGLVIGAVYMLRAVRSIFQGAPVEICRNSQAISLQSFLPALFLLFYLIIFGLWPNILSNLL